MKKILLILLIALSATACKKERSTPENTTTPHKFEVYYPGSVDTYFVRIITYNNDGSVTLLVVDPMDHGKNFELTTSHYKMIY